MSKVYYCVRAKVYDNGKIVWGMNSEECEEKPTNQCGYTRNYDWYEDWFETYQEAASFADDYSRA